MDSSPFLITEHVVDGQHIREYPRATRAGDDALKLAVKRYIPKSNPNPRSGDVTIIGAHGSGFPKELYEPIWEEIYSRLDTQGIRIRSIWIADTASQSASAILNEENLGNDPSWFDHARDLLYLINHFRADMPRPLVGIGHSLGAGQLTLLSLMHSRLFTSLIIMEPVIVSSHLAGKGPIFVSLSLKRRDVWSSRSEAAKYFKKSYKKWDPRVLERWLDYGLRELRSGDESFKEAGAAVTLATSRHQEVNMYLRPNFQNKKPLNANRDPGTQQSHDAVFYADIIGPPDATHPFYRSETVILWSLLKHVRPSVLYLYGETSPVSTPDLRAEKVERTGSGIGGSGGYKSNRVKEVTFPGAGHHLPFEAVSGVSDATSTWLKQEITRWKVEEERINEGWLDLGREARTSVSDDWLTEKLIFARIEVAVKDLSNCVVALSLPIRSRDITVGRSGPIISMLVYVFRSHNYWGEIHNARPHLVGEDIQISSHIMSSASLNINDTLHDFSNSKSLFKDSPIRTKESPKNLHYHLTQMVWQDFLTVYWKALGIRCFV
ncbi:conserved hypothetical protein [Talaromyces stipitatus ATCC 10500]|uniref:AB hydrolase-1 domain-containing protein n=1 Tax=Talaromyces stipitatus (strain ATCC 10500 / CBS 375.48 / QM 6759 / NRRL 1006) TaxID=441959 RepID=B8MMC2_TALSN|nr:uncharacterized protein TSTA_099280 [Talaromyces stipitatus ATCC 10500]EED13676.1 conserved hypothetical protein [Talaromyces stipitatus ATCC 10500]